MLFQFWDFKSLWSIGCLYSTYIKLNVNKEWCRMLFVGIWPICLCLHYRVGSTHSATIQGSETKVKSVAILHLLWSHGRSVGINSFLSSCLFTWFFFPLFLFSFLNSQPLLQFATIFQFSFQIMHHLLSLSATSTLVFWLSKIFPSLFL